MNNKNLLFALLISACGMQACQNTNKTGNDPDSLSSSSVDSSQMAMADTSTMNNAQDTTSFMYKAAVGGMMEVEAGKLAQQQAGNSKVKQFAALMVKDHTKANTELQAIATTKNVTLPTSFPAKEQAHMDEMKKMSGSAFDKHYIDMMIKDHVKTVDIFKTAANDTDTDVSNFAKKTLPVIQDHHKQAVAINSSL